MSEKQTVMYQVSTLQALAMGYTRPVVTVGELLRHGDTGLGTFEDVGGEMIVLDGRCYRADETGAVAEAAPGTGVPFASVTELAGCERFEMEDIPDIAALRTVMDLKIEEGFGLNSMHMARIDGFFESVSARSESAFRSQHVSLKKVLEKTQRDFRFSDVPGTLVCVYYPDYMEGINAPGWHFHFLSADRKRGGHVFELRMAAGGVQLDRISSIEIRLPEEPAFDTYSLKQASGEEIRQVEQGAERETDSTTRR